MHSQNEDEIEIPKERYISAKKRQQIIDELRLVNNIIMEYQKMKNLLDNTSNQLSKFKTKNWIEMNDQSRGVYNTSSDIRFKAIVLKPSLYGHSDGYILVKEKTTITGAGDYDAEKRTVERNKGAIFKNSAPFINCNGKKKKKNTEIDNAKNIDIVMPMYNLKEYSDNCSKTSGSLWQYYREESNDNLADSESFKSKIKIKGRTTADGNLILTWSSTCVITNSTGAGE